MAVMVNAYAVMPAFATGGVTMTPQPSCSEPCDRHAVVFVHGLFGGADTWVNGAVSFPELLRTDQRFCDECDVFVVTYPTKPSQSHKIRLAEIGQGLAEQLDHLANYNSIHLIGHSMGGNAILVSLMFTKFLHEDAHQRFTKYKSVILLGTPIEGASIANFRWLVEHLIGDDPQLMALKHFGAWQE